MPKVISIGKQNFASLRENILLDEYDTPMQEAYLHGYWREFTAFIRNFFNATFKTNPYLERAVLTGITRVSKESVFSDLNNLNVGRQVLQNMKPALVSQKKRFFKL